MRVVTFQQLLWGTARMLGLTDPGGQFNGNSGTLSNERASDLAEYLTNRAGEGWGWEWWPEWTLTEQREYRATYVAATAYTATQEVWHPGSLKYYQALQATTGNAPATWNGSTWVTADAYWAECAASYGGSDWLASTAYAVNTTTGRVRNPADNLFYQCHTAHTSGATFDSTKFGLLTPFNRYIAFEQTGESKIWRCEGIYRRDPRVFPRNPGRCAKGESDLGVQAGADAPSQPWIRFQKPPPEFSAVPWAAGTFTLGDVRYYATTKDCYKVIVSSTTDAPTVTASWERQQLPEVLAPFVKRAAKADALGDQKQTARMAKELDLAYGDLADARDQMFDGQGNHSTALAGAWGR